MARDRRAGRSLPAVHPAGLLTELHATRRLAARTAGIAGWWERFVAACDPSRGSELNRIGEWRLRWHISGPVATDRYRRRLWAWLPTTAQRRLIGARVGYLLDPMGVEALACEVCWKRAAVGVLRSLLDPKVSVLLCRHCARSGLEPLRVLLVYVGPRGLTPPLPSLEAFEPPALQVVRRSLSGPHADPALLQERIGDEVALHARNGTGWAKTRRHQARIVWRELQQAVGRGRPTVTVAARSRRQPRRLRWRRWTR